MLRPVRFAALALALAATAALGACQKQSVDPTEICVGYPPDTATQLMGRWELTQTTSGMNGRTSPADPALRREIVFDAAGQSQTFLNGSLESTTPYTLRQATSRLTQKTETFIVYGAATSNALLYITALSPTTLSIAPDAYDGGSQTYTRTR